MEALAAEKNRLEAAERQQAEHYKAEGRIKIDASFLDNEHGRWFLPGAGKTEWFKDFEAGPEMVIIPAGEFKMGSLKN